MESAGGLVIGLSFVFGCLFLALVAELYYLLWWKKRISNRESEEEEEEEDAEDFSSGNYAKELKLSDSAAAKSDLELGAATAAAEGKDSLFKGDGGGEGEGDGDGGGEEESVELELMRLHNLAGPPRFLFTIKEESKEDLESDDGRKSRCDDDSRRRGLMTKSLNDILLAAVDTATPPPLSNPLESYHHRRGFNNPLFESSAEAELNRLRSSPPPKFKFMRDAEEKLLKRLLLEEAQRRGGGGESNEGNPMYPAMAAADVIGGGSFTGFLCAKNREVRIHRLPSPCSTSSQDGGSGSG